MIEKYVIGGLTLVVALVCLIVDGLINKKGE